MGSTLRFVFVMLVIAACSTPIDEAAAPIPLAADPQFLTADLHVLRYGPGAQVLRYEARTGDVVDVTPSQGFDDKQIVSILSTSDRSRTYAIVVERVDFEDPEAPGIGRIRPIDPAAPDGLGDPIIESTEGAVLQCLGRAARPDSIATILLDDTETFPPTGRWAEIDPSGNMQVIREIGPYILCPRRARAPERWAWTNFISKEPFEASLILEIDSHEREIRWPDCVLQPHEFSSDSSRLLVTARCEEEDDTRNGLYIFDVLSGEPESDRPLASGTAAVPTWSPDGTLIAYTRTSDRAREESATVAVLRETDGSQLEVPSPSTSWSSWILTQDRATASSISS